LSIASARRYEPRRIALHALPVFRFEALKDSPVTEEEEIDARAAFAGLTLRPEDRELVRQGWSLIRQHLDRVLAEPLPPTAEPAAQFRPEPS
jgi:hypothetical protein